MLEFVGASLSAVSEHLRRAAAKLGASSRLSLISS
jgi:hypothetical protein